MRESVVTPREDGREDHRQGESQVEDRRVIRGAEDAASQAGPFAQHDEDGDGRRDHARGASQRLRSTTGGAARPNVGVELTRAVGGRA